MQKRAINCDKDVCEHNFVEKKCLPAALFPRINKMQQISNKSRKEIVHLDMHFISQFPGNICILIAGHMFSVTFNKIKTFSVRILK